MSTPTLRREPSGTIYLHWTDPSPVRGQRGRSRRRSTGTADMDEAKRFLGRFLLLEQQSAAPGSDLTIGDLWSVYEAKHIEKSVASDETLRSCWKNLSAHFAMLPVSGVSQDTVDSYELKRTKGVIGRPSQQSTIRRELGALKACLNWCADPKRRLLAADQVPPFDLPPEGDPNDRWLKPEEIARLMDAARSPEARAQGRMAGRMGRGERFLWLGLETAARSEAIRELTWDRVDLETWTIDYNVPGRKRTKKRRAIVPVSQALRGPLTQMYEERLADDGYVLDNPAPVWKLIKRIAARAKVADVSPHVLRHTAATHMARRGVPLWLVAKILGNTLGMVERVYAKHCPDDLRTAVDAISGPVVEMGK